MNDQSIGWNMNIIRQTVVEEDVDLITSIRLRPNSFPDMIGWHYNDSGIYSVKSGYWLASHIQEHQNEVQPPPGSPILKTAFWKMKIAPKLQHFMWRVLSEAIPVGTILMRRGITTNAQCKRCCQDNESIEHLFFTCPYVQALWRGIQNLHRDICNPSSSLQNRFQAIIECYNNHWLSDLERQLPIWILWRIWKSRNILVYQQRGSSWHQDLVKAVTEAKEWVTITSNGSLEQNLQRPQRVDNHHSCWLKPEEGYIKCNYDCNYHTNDNPSNAGWIFRDSGGFLLNAGHSSGQVCASSLEAELQALIMAMQQAWLKGYKHVIFEGDNHTVQKLLNGEMQNFKVHYLIREVEFWKLKFSRIKFVWTRRSNNKAADR